MENYNWLEISGREDLVSERAHLYHSRTARYPWSPAAAFVPISSSASMTHLYWMIFYSIVASLITGRMAKYLFICLCASGVVEIIGNCSFCIHLSAWVVKSRIPIFGRVVLWRTQCVSLSNLMESLELDSIFSISWTFLMDPLLFIPMDVAFVSVGLAHGEDLSHFVLQIWNICVSCQCPGWESI